MSEHHAETQDAAPPPNAVTAASGWKRRRLQASLGGGIALEWYDWNIYGLMASFLAPHFFPNSNPVTSTLSALMVFAIGFGARPVGAVLLGPIADRVSHRKVMLLAVGSTALMSLLIGLLPTYEMIGIWAGVLLVCCRLVQGISTGIEAPVSTAIVVELVPEERRGRSAGVLLGTFIWLGILASMLVSAGASGTLSSNAMHEWGWRIPFIVGGLLGIIVLYLRTHLPETLVEGGENANRSTNHAPDSVWTALWKHRFGLLAIVFVVAGTQVTNYTWIAGLPNLALSTYDENATAVFLLGAGYAILGGMCGPIVGSLADRWGSPRAFTITRLAAVPIGFALLIYTEQNILIFAVIMLVIGIVPAMNHGLYNYVTATLLPRTCRTTGIGIGYSIGVSLFGGTAPYFALWTESHDLPWLFPLYIGILSAVSVVVYWMARRRGEIHMTP